MSKLLGLVVSLIVFLGWMRLVGNLHVVETVIGLVFAVVAGIWVLMTTKKKFLHL